MRVVLCDHGLCEAEGHHFNLAAAVREELSARGIDHVVLAHRCLGPALAGELGAVPTFEVSPYDGLADGGALEVVRSFAHVALRFANGLRHAGLRRTDVVVVPTGRPAEMVALALARPRPRAVVVNLMMDDVTTARGTPLVRGLYRLGWTALRAARPGRTTVLTCASAPLARAIGRAAGARVEVVPMTKGYPATGPARTATAPTVAFLGGPRPNKGFDLVPRIAELCVARLPQCRIVVHGMPADELHAVGEAVEILPAGLPRHAYFDLLARVDVAVLPYDAAAFGQMTSGVFSEAVACGIVAVVPAGTWMADVVASGRAAGVVFEGRTAAGITAAVECAVSDLPRLRRLAADRSAAWRASQSVGAWVDAILRLANSA